MSRTKEFRRQHRELQKLARVLTRAALVSGTPATEIQAHLARFVGKLRVHAAMETEALYPSLLDSADGDVRSKAARLHEELGPLYGRVDGFLERWGTAAAIEDRRIRFRIELTRLIAKLGWRMMREDRELYPMAVALMGGLLSSTALSLLLLPTYYRLGEIVDRWTRSRLATARAWRPTQVGWVRGRVRAH